MNKIQSEMVFMKGQEDMRMDFGDDSALSDKR
jgi:hypothetical protein